jgi:transposase-like protein
LNRKIAWNYNVIEININKYWGRVIMSKKSNLLKSLKFIDNVLKKNNISNKKEIEVDKLAKTIKHKINPS